jgi:hypothetical protein
MRRVFFCDHLRVELRGGSGKRLLCLEGVAAGEVEMEDARKGVIVAGGVGESATGRVEGFVL